LKLADLEETSAHSETSAQMVAAAAREKKIAVQTLRKTKNTKSNHDFSERLKLRFIAVPPAAEAAKTFPRSRGQITTFKTEPRVKSDPLQASTRIRHGSFTSTEC